MTTTTTPMKPQTITVSYTLRVSHDVILENVTDTDNLEDIAYQQLPDHLKDSEIMSITYYDENDNQLGDGYCE